MSEMIATRDAFGKSLEELGGEYDFYVLDADLSKATKTVFFKEKYPDRFFNIGIAECNMMGVAAGIASCGKTVVASSFAMFSAGRAYEQVRNSICYTNLNVKVIGTHGGVAIGEDGGSHQCIEDLSLMRTLPNMTVLNPSDGKSTKDLLEAAINHKGPVYIRLGKNPQPILYDNEMDIKIGKGVILREGTDIAIFATGVMVSIALEAADLLSRDGIEAKVIDIHTIKPIDKDLIIASAKQTRAVITVEDHNVIGGLGSAVSEVLSESCPIMVKKIGVEDVFGRSGKSEDILERYGLTAQNIYNQSKQVVLAK